MWRPHARRPPRFGSPRRRCSRLSLNGRRRWRSCKRSSGGTWRGRRRSNCRTKRRRPSPRWTRQSRRRMRRSRSFRPSSEATSCARRKRRRRSAPPRRSCHPKRTTVQFVYPRHSSRGLPRSSTWLLAPPSAATTAEDSHHGRTRPYGANELDPCSSSILLSRRGHPSLRQGYACCRRRAVGSFGSSPATRASLSIRFLLGTHGNYQVLCWDKLVGGCAHKWRSRSHGLGCLLPLTALWNCYVHIVSYMPAPGFADCYQRELWIRRLRGITQH
mmetsp:Transcript_35704/g.81772  ORF Transcript_35704/g.81772 Transcript_35704/m.81772 type:complete len:273 (-) Transcript_35704:181-999(-)